MTGTDTAATPVSPTAPAGPPYLTKSSYVRATKCARLLWLSWHHRLPYEDPQPGTPAAVGIEIGEHAQRLFPDGFLVDQPPWAHTEAVERTRALMADPSVPAIFEAAFEADGVRIRADIVENLGGGRWGLREVKSSTRVKADHVIDAAIQAHVMSLSGVEPTSIELIHVNREYVFQGGEIDWNQFFARTDIAEQVAAERIDMADTVGAFREVLNRAAEPDIAPGPHCPKPCDYWDRCTAAKPADWIMNLPRLSEKRFADLTARGIERISDIPADIDLTEHQDRMRNVIVTGWPYVSDGLRNALRPLDGPASYLDFEAMNPAIPVYPGTRPYERLPFQWSLHRNDGAAGLTHEDYLAPADPNLDPRAGFEGSFSIKTVGRALAPHFSYDGLNDVANGEQAAGTFQRLILTDASPEERTRLTNALLAYCRLDTLALVETHQALKRLAGPST